MSENIGSVGGERDMLDDLCDQQLETAEVLHKTRMTLKAVMKTVNMLQSKVITLEAAMVSREENEERGYQAGYQRAMEMEDIPDTPVPAESIVVSGDRLVWDEEQAMFVECN